MFNEIICLIFPSVFSLLISNTEVLCKLSIGLFFINPEAACRKGSAPPLNYSEQLICSVIVNEIFRIMKGFQRHLNLALEQITAIMQINVDTIVSTDVFKLSSPE